MASLALFEVVASTLIPPSNQPICLDSADPSTDCCRGRRLDEGVNLARMASSFEAANVTVHRGWEKCLLLRSAFYSRGRFAFEPGEQVCDVEVAGPEPQIRLIDRTGLRPHAPQHVRPLAVRYFASCSIPMQFCEHHTRSASAGGW